MSERTHRKDIMAGDTYVIRLYADRHCDTVRPPYQSDCEKVLWVDFRVVAIVGTDENGTRLYQNEDSQIVEDIGLAEPVAKGFVKWDGCTQWTVDGHVDSRGGLEEFHRTIELARKEAMGLLDQDPLFAHEYDE